MRNQDEVLLEKAYLSISKPVPGPSSEEMDHFDHTEELLGDIDDGSEIADEPPMKPVSVVGSMGGCNSCGEEESENMWGGEEDEEDEMTITNLDSIRDSVTKVASFCAGGGHLETWQQQKLAIAMDNLAEVARRIRR